MKRITITIEEKILKSVLDLQANLVKHTEENWNTSKVITVLSVFGTKQATIQELAKIAKDLKKK